MVTLEGLIWPFGAAIYGHFGGGGHIEGVKVII